MEEYLEQEELMVRFNKSELFGQQGYPEEDTFTSR